MIDANGKVLYVYSRVAFRSSARDAWVEGVVREIGMNPNSHDDEARVDNGDPGNDDLATNGFHIAACVESCNIEVLP